MITKEELNNLFDYVDGNLIWKINARSNHVKGSKAGCIKGSGYIYIKINNKLYLAHRLIFLMHHGFLPKCIDHIDGNKTNNKIENLREATNQENQYNRKLSKNNKSGIKGISWNKLVKKWQIYLSINGKNISFGFFDDLELAELIINEAREKYHGKFARNS
jgi:hypothetical protein